MKGRPIIAVHAIRNKGRTIASNDMRTALQRMSDWEERHK